MERFTAASLRTIILQMQHYRISIAKVTVGIVQENVTDLQFKLEISLLPTMRRRV